MNNSLSVGSIEKLEVYATIVENEQLHEQSYKQMIYVECETLEMSELKLADTNYNSLKLKRNSLVEQQINNQLNPEEIHLTTLEIESYNNELNKLENYCRVSLEDIYPDVNFDECSYVYSIKKEDFNDNGFKKIATDITSDWVKQQIDNMLTITSPVKIIIKLVLSSGKVLEINKTIMKL